MITAYTVTNVFDKSHPDPTKWVVTQRDVTLEMNFLADEYELISGALVRAVRERTPNAQADMLRAMADLLEKRGEAREE